MSTTKYSNALFNGGYSNRGAITQQTSRIISQHYRNQGFEVETITKFMKSSKVLEKGAENVEVPVKMEDELQDDIRFIRSEVFKEIQRQKPYSCIIENTLSKMKYDPLKQLLTDLLALIDKEEERIKQQLYKLQKSRLDKRKVSRQINEKRGTNEKSAYLTPDQPHQARPFREQWSERKDQLDNEQQSEDRLRNPEQLRVESRKKEHGQLTIDCEDRISQKRLKQLLKYIKEAEKKRDQLTVQVTNLQQLYGIKKAGYIKSREDNEKEKHNYVSRITQSNERNRLEEEQKQRFLQNLQQAEEQYNNRRKQITHINQEIQELHLEEEMLKQRKTKLNEQIEELNMIIERLDRRIDNMNKELSKLHAQYGRQSANRNLREKAEKAEKEPYEAGKPRHFEFKLTSASQNFQNNKVNQQAPLLYSIEQNA